jgi:hypothetical protein
MCDECSLFEFKVPLVCPSTEGVPAHREGRYSLYISPPDPRLQQEKYSSLSSTVNRSVYNIKDCAVLAPVLHYFNRDYSKF